MINSDGVATGGEAAESSGAARENSDEIMNIFLCCDDGYAKYVPVLQVSLYENHKNRRVDVYVAHLNRISQKNQDLIRKTAAMYGQRVEFLVPESDAPYKELLSLTTAKKLKRFGDGDSSFLKFSIAELMPAHVKRCLYLDIDIVVDSSLDSVYDMDFKGHAIIAKTQKDEEYPVVLNAMTIEEKEKIENGFDLFKRKKTWFGTGVFIVNLDVWRTLQIKTQDFVTIKKRYLMGSGTIDGFLLVLMFFKKCYYITRKDRMGFNFGERSSNFLTHYQKYDPMIIHYAHGNAKPWKYHFSKEQVEQYDFFKDSKKESPVFFNETTFILHEIWWKYAALAPNYEELAHDAKVRTAAAPLEVFQKLNNQTSYINNLASKLQKTALAKLKTHTGNILAENKSGADVIFPAGELAWELPEVAGDSILLKVYNPKLGKSGRVLIPFRAVPAGTKVRLAAELEVRCSSKRLALHLGNCTKRGLTKGNIYNAAIKDNVRTHIETEFEIGNHFNCVFFSKYCFKKPGDWIKIYNISIQKLEEVSPTTEPAEEKPEP